MSSQNVSGLFPSTLSPGPGLGSDFDRQNIWYVYNSVLYHHLSAVERLMTAVRSFMGQVINDPIPTDGFDSQDTVNQFAM